MPMPNKMSAAIKADFTLRSLAATALAVLALRLGGLLSLA
jgi:hypothetical protein